MSDGGQQELGAGQAAQPQLEREEEVREGECSTRGLMAQQAGGSDTLGAQLACLEKAGAQLVCGVLAQCDLQVASKTP